MQYIPSGNSTVCFEKWTIEIGGCIYIPSKSCGSFGICYMFSRGYPLVIQQKTMVNHIFCSKNYLWTGIFHSYVQLPEGSRGYYITSCNHIRKIFAAVSQMVGQQMENRMENQQIHDARGYYFY